MHSGYPFSVLGGSGSEGGHTVGVLVQANHGQRRRLAVNGVPVGRMFDDVALPAEFPGPGSEVAGSNIVLVATDAPLLPHQCTREAIVNALLTAETTEGRDGIVAHGLDGERLAAAVAGG